MQASTEICRQSLGIFSLTLHILPDVITAIISPKKNEGIFEGVHTCMRREGRIIWEIKFKYKLCLFLYLNHSDINLQIINNLKCVPLHEPNMKVIYFTFSRKITACMITDSELIKLEGS